jgi:heptosyltransferase-2
LILRFGAVGDVVLTAGALLALKKALPEAKRILMVRPGLGALARQLPGLDQVVEGDGLEVAALARLIQPTVILDLHGSLRSRVVRLGLVEVPVVAIQKRPFWEKPFVKVGLRKAWAKTSLETRYHQAVEQLVGRALPQERLQWGPEGDVSALLSGLKAPILGLSPGAAWESKRWGKFPELAALARTKGWSVVVAGGPWEEALCAEVGERNLCGKVPLSLLGALWKACTVVVANDSGPLHLARAVGVPVVAIFGPTQPLGIESVVRNPVECAPCSFFGDARCPKGHHRCMQDLKVEQVWEAIATVTSA